MNKQDSRQSLHLTFGALNHLPLKKTNELELLDVALKSDKDTLTFRSVCLYLILRQNPVVQAHMFFLVEDDSVVRVVP